MDVLERVKKTLVERGLAGPDNPVLLMVSGGSDSVALAYLGKQLQDDGAVGMVAMLHVNHLLRGEDSNADQAFVEQLAQVLGLPVFTCQIDVAQLVQRSGENMEAVARHERYLAANEALESLCLHASAPLADGRIFTAHTADDRVENFYMRSIVGTGPGGFRSMMYENGPVVRPCLDLGRQDLRDYVEAREAAGQPCACDAEGALWREDATNAHTDRFRAYVRHELVPVAKARNPKLLETLTRSMNLIADEDDMLDAMAVDAARDCVRWEGDFYAAVLLPSFGKQPLPIARRVVFGVLQQFLGVEARVETATVDGVLGAFADGAPVSGYTANVQGDLAVSANKRGVRVEPMAAYRARRKKA
ncbi:MAG: tRNA lysidine(34) synthetase TilS [Coriobacteriia bacterium]|nr:tRNA lysidine(34) synthetase TilS [Coriobacteriia bacterium]